jgi:ABC-type cobalamin/Fe3+-siderophores transport system ATPase subunit
MGTRSGGEAGACISTPQTTVSAYPALSFVGVDYGYRRGKHVVSVLARISLEVFAQEVISVLAERAQGKTTFLRVAAGTARPRAGRVLLSGEDVWGLPDKRRSRLLGTEIGWVDTASPEVRAPALTYVALPLMRVHGQREAYARARDALARVGAAECADQYWEELADWERALVAVAQGIAREPRLLLVDDVMTTLGIVESEELGFSLATLAREMGFAVLASASDANATIWSDRVASLAGGELLLASPPTRARTNVIELPMHDATGHSTQSAS